MSRRVLLMCGLIACLYMTSVRAQGDRGPSKSRSDPPSSGGQADVRTPSVPPTSQERRNAAKIAGDERKRQAAAAGALPAGAFGSARGIGPVRINSVLSVGRSPTQGGAGVSAVAECVSLASGQVVCPNAQGKYLIGGFLYIICGQFLVPELFYICCEETYYLSTVDGQPVECCAGNYFIPETEICCGKYYYDKIQGGLEAKCCGEDYFIEATEICCADAFFPRNEYGCCADSPFQLSQFCCAFNFEFPVGSPICLGAGIGGGGVFPGTGGGVFPGTVCGFPGTICCDQVPYAVQDNHKCCGKLYVPNSYLCCGNTRPYCSSLYQCCAGGSNGYIPAIDTCCPNGDVLPLGSSCPVVDNSGTPGNNVYYKK